MLYLFYIIYSSLRKFKYILYVIIGWVIALKFTRATEIIVENKDDLSKVISNVNNDSIHELTIRINDVTIELNEKFNVTSSVEKIYFVGKSIESSVLKFTNLIDGIVLTNSLYETNQEIQFVNITLIGHMQFFSCVNLKFENVVLNGAALFDKTYHNLWNAKIINGEEVDDYDDDDDDDEFLNEEEIDDYDEDYDGEFLNERELKNNDEKFLNKRETKNDNEFLNLEKELHVTTTMKNVTYYAYTGDPEFCLNLFGNVIINDSKFYGHSSCAHSIIYYQGNNYTRFTVSNSYFNGMHEIRPLFLVNTSNAIIDSSTFENGYGKGNGG